MTTIISSPPKQSSPESHGLVDQLLIEVKRRAPADASALLASQSNEIIADVLSRVSPSLGLKILLQFPEDRQKAILPETPSNLSDQWQQNEMYPEGTIGRLMEPPVGLFLTGNTVRGAVEQLRLDVQTGLITYGYVVDQVNRLLGVVVMRDLLLADPQQTLDELMIRDPFILMPDMSIKEAMQEVIHRHYPVYPVCDKEGHLVGLLRGYALFEEHTIQITAQSGRMVGVVNEERLSTSWQKSLRFRHPWLQLNLLTAFSAAFVVGLFENTIDRIVVLAAFLPVLAGQSGNTGCQALAVTLREMTLGELDENDSRILIVKEAWLGLVNGALVGAVAGLAMIGYATVRGYSSPWTLGLVVLLAMIGSCIVSGVSGALVPMGLKKWGADPATASSILLTTAADVAGLGLFLGLATLFVL